MKDKLTIGMVAYDDFDGVYFSIQSIRLHHPEILKDIEFIIIDNNPNGAHGAAIMDLAHWIKQPFQYIPFTDFKSTAVREQIFKHARTDYVLCMDSHVLFELGSLKKLLDYFRANKDDGNLLQGPLLYDDLMGISTHFKSEWRDKMWGTWAYDERALDPSNEPFEIPMQGLGVFACRKDAWLGFNSHFRGFGGEEGYIHEKFRQNGKKTICLPFLRWMHRFGRPNGVPYPLKNEDRIINYFLGHLELNIDYKVIIDHFKEWYSEQDLNSMLEIAKQKLNT